MRYLLIAVLFTLASCESTDSDVQLSGEADLNVQDNFTECQIRQEGAFYFVRQNGGLDPYEMSIDLTITYTPGWIDLTLADAERVAPLTQLEIDILNGTIP